MISQSIEQRLEQLLAAVAELHRPCRYCEAPLYFVRHRDGLLMPYTAEGENHFFNCPYTERLRKNRKEASEQKPLLDTAPVPD